MKKLLTLIILCTLGFAGIAYADIDDSGLIAWFPLDNYYLNSGNTYTVGSAISCPATSTPEVSGILGQAFNFTGTQYANCGVVSALQTPTTAVSISAWVYIPTGTTENATPKIASQDYANPRVAPYTAYNLMLCSGSGSNKNYCFETYKTASTYDDLVGPLVTTVGTNRWVLVTATMSGSAKKLYINGKLSASSANGATINYAGTGSFGIGTNSVYGELFKGRIDDVRVWNRPLSANDVAQLYYQGFIGHHIGI